MKTYITLKSSNWWSLCSLSLSCSLCIKSFTWCDRESVIRGSALWISSTRALTSVLRFTKRKLLLLCHSGTCTHYLKSCVVLQSRAFIKCQEHHPLGGRGLWRGETVKTHKEHCGRGGSSWDSPGPIFTSWDFSPGRSRCEDPDSSSKQGQEHPGSEHELLLYVFSFFLF